MISAIKANTTLVTLGIYATQILVATKLGLMVPMKYPCG